ncbi:hypothetical protein CSAL01_09527 [Colletotrichum salicis]|uniref:DUF8212 domain-containing protein n=1 Tax=Colletotrichum salicis TaxID=1209931 RepID=A0A135SQE1_9PEZI|nr:hypothetical protein CSAL01_09527 [Colletotrichum salicis]
MRLLNTTTLKVKEFVSERPRYAILFHIWGSQEIVLQDTEAEGEAPSSIKAGWKKIEGSCALALKDGFDWIWVDTCCIDTSSSSEFSEAINSMFHVPPLKYAPVIGFQDLATDLDLDHIAAIENDLKTFLRSRWFTRGWTLQELVAPRRIDCHASDWSFLGSEADLVDIIHTHTMIDKEALKGVGNLSSFSVWSRMQWDARRETTRVEDMAYCLLGIFDINMPLLYGEGDRAFRRLQEEILRTIEDYSLMAWTSYDMTPQPLRIYSSALASHPRGFGIMRLDTTHVPTAAINRDFDKGMQRIIVQGSHLISPNKELMLGSIRPYFEGVYENSAHSHLEGVSFSPPVLSPRGISITMSTNRALSSRPNTWLAWTALDFHTPKDIYGLCIGLSDESGKYTNWDDKASRRGTERLYAVPFSMPATFRLTKFYLRATPEYYIESVADSWDLKPDVSQLRFDRRNEAVSATVLATYSPLRMKIKGDVYAFRTKPQKFQRAIAIMCDPIWLS